MSKFRTALLLCNDSAYGFIVTESAHSKSPAAMGQILSWLHSDVLTVFAASAKTWLNRYTAFFLYPHYLTFRVSLYGLCRNSSDLSEPFHFASFFSKKFRTMS